MRYIFLGLSIIIAGLLVFGGYNYYLNFTRTKLAVVGLKSEYFPGSNMDFNVNVMNTSRTEKFFLIDSRIRFKTETVNFPKTFFVLSKRGEIASKYTHFLLEDFAAGNYQVEIELKDKTVTGEKTLVKKIVPFKVKKRPVKPPVIPLAGNIKFINLPDKINFSGKSAIKILVENIANREGRFYVSIKLVPPRLHGNIVYKPEILSRTLNLNKKSKKSVKFGHKLSKDKPDGKYLLVARLSEAGTSKLLSTKETAVSVIDQPPKIVFKDIGLAAEKEKQGIYKVEVTDDKGVKSVKYYRRNIKNGKITGYPMTLASGNNSEGIWSYSAGVVKKAHRFKFYVAAVDTKNQETKTEEYSIVVLKK
jgi:hypothetical protein